MRMEPLTQEAIAIARKRKQRCIELKMSHPVGANHKYPKLAVGFSGPLPEKFFKRLMKLMTEWVTSKD